MLTLKQRELLDFLQEYEFKNKASPSFDEMREAIGLASKSGIHRLISGLEERGFIRRLANRARAIEIIKNNHNDLAAKSHPDKDNNVVKADFSGSAHIELPMLGRIAAGTPIEAISDPTAFLSIPSSMVESGEHYALEIVGDSMIEAGIHDGDTVIIRKTEQAINGDIVVALVDGYEATLKKFRRDSDRIALEAANPNYETRYFTTNQVSIQGKLSGLIRKYR
ncbi:transcriptional repressor LexA [Alphaproteobacteria bacterium]|jgi:repressor LexA|nr:transcriptional repressor LexA [Alphaproteobacteria bacterium]MBT5799473.1 transcriptional repressor LexA [Alphaproteobacteria bacterium]MDA9815554.1 transcriptional repressor LexA [Alphaproteobacteria bacterium]MDC0395294.1 transcriptional repressor LexA [Alphaproteobacteria bacterium]